MEEKNTIGITILGGRYDVLDKQLEAVMDSFNMPCKVTITETIMDGLALINTTAVGEDGKQFECDVTIPLDAERDLADDIVESIIKQLISDILTHGLNNDKKLNNVVFGDCDNPSDLQIHATKAEVIKMFDDF